LSRTLPSQATAITSRFRRPIKETGRRSWWSRLWNCGILELWEFLKWANHYCCFVKDYTAVVKPLTVLTSPKVKWAWNNAQQQAFNDIKQKVGTSPIFTNPVKGKPFHLCPDASNSAVRAALEQEGEDVQWHVGAYGSHSLTNTERNVAGMAPL